MTTFDISDRDDTRKSYSRTVSFTAKDRTYKGASKDLSSGGMFIETDGSFSVGEIITITIPFTGKKKNIKVPAEIMRIIDEGIGVKFIKKE
jgi:Tfp pilus assembly protein PilZ